MTTDNHDPFAFAGRGDDVDDRVLALFRDWLDASRTTDLHAHNKDRTEYDAALDRREEIETEIISSPGGAAALAIKAYFYLRFDVCHDWAPEDATLRFSELFDEPDGWQEKIIVSILRDAAKQVPELAELAAPIIHEDASLIDADINLRWCRWQLPGLLTDRPSAFSAAEIREKLFQALNRIATTEAKTPRGDEIKRRYAPELRAPLAEALATGLGGAK